MAEPVVLINVDDNEPSRYAKTRILTRAGFIVHDAGTGREALDLAARHNPALMLLDVNLPDIDGIEVCRQLKQSRASASIFILQISASATTAPHAISALNSGADCYLTEPVDPDVLVATVGALLRLRSAERALADANAQLTALNADLRRSNEDLQQFAFVASHDLQEPLRNVISFSTLLDRSMRGRLNDNEQQYLEIILQGAHRMRALIDDLLQYSQIRQQPAGAGSVDLNQVLKWAIENLQQPMTESSARVDSETLPTVCGDQAQLGHLFQNLVGNAVKYRRPEAPPHIRISAEKQNRHWVVRVQDNGMGVPKEHCETIFAPFKRLHGREIPGTGIGLALCRRVVEAHEGQIWIDSTPGEGSTFSFTLPGA
jgi:two-component system, sensor histidine kinase and response regulator